MLFYIGIGTVCYPKKRADNCLRKCIFFDLYFINMITYFDAFRMYYCRCLYLYLIIINDRSDTDKREINK